jgi:hypothetical protein
MHSVLSYIVAAGVGVLIAHFISRAPEWRSMRLSQLVFVPAAMVLCVYFLPEQGAATSADMGSFVCFLACVGFLILLLAPNIAHHFGAGLSNFLDNYDWTPTEEEIALRPVKRLIDKDNYRQAIAELDELLKKHKPTYEAVLLKAKLLHHIGRVDETETALLDLIALSNSTEQQLAVMDNLALLEEHHQAPENPPAAGARRIEIHHELVLFQTDGDSRAAYKELPPGTYEVEELMHRNRRWLKLAGDNWGNAAMCWEAILSSRLPPARPPKKGPFQLIARMHQSISAALKGKPRRQLQADAQQLFKEANQFIRCDDWHKALPLLQKASAGDPDRYEFAYRWAQAVRYTANDAVTAKIVGRILQQSRWTEDEEHMLEQLKRPLAE